MFILAPKNLSGIFDELKFPSEIFGCEDNDKQSAILVVGGFPNIYDLADASKSLPPPHCGGIVCQ